MYRAMCELLVAAHVAPKDALSQLESTVGHLTESCKGWSASVANNEAMQLAEKMQGTTPIIYGGPLTAAAAYKWKIDANENAKNTAWSNSFPELNHNEFIGWSSHPKEKPFTVIDLISSFEHPRVLRRFDVTDQLLEGMKPAAVKVEAKGDSVLEQLLYLVLLGDFATTYLAILNHVDPTPVDLVEKFKLELG